MTLRLDVRGRTRQQAAEEFNQNGMCLMLVDAAFVDAYAAWSGPIEFKLERDADGIVSMTMRDATFSLAHKPRVA
jgi:hypothetical protein